MAREKSENNTERKLNNTYNAMLLFWSFRYLRIVEKRFIRGKDRSSVSSHDAGRKKTEADSRITFRRNKPYFSEARIEYDRWRNGVFKFC